MFEYLKGIISYKKLDYIALDVGGIGYKIFISLRTYEKLNTNSETKFFIFNYIKEDEYKLIGFLEERERNLFEMLLSVKGIGMSLALSIMSSFDCETIRTLILEGDYVTLKNVPKLGEKKAQQIILDLKSKIKKIDFVSIEQSLNINVNYEIEDELIMALEGLGYNKKDIDKIIDKNKIKSYKNIQEAIKDTLKNLQIK
ncbi:MAG: Holliday junction branch migration protein RuvA [Fusobacterium perfoetens]|uniref:Holliday junction branch migration protein RuvA n=1 Tax=Fusobacterium perfoetens TaxID=852 RepID=UPI0023F4D845|nr:Holliday junction branch migration protein RuvA [Fusobacterium perfoetens]MCI6151559.1 Holliday junction branch migration protein RuvA [Fusobacterium perfoetens]MDY3237217.1 Holliday junction branch migration protein RuvA [Fusobacterium perfoetens]